MGGRPTRGRTLAAAPVRPGALNGTTRGVTWNSTPKWPGFPARRTRKGRRGAGSGEADQIDPSLDEGELEVELDEDLEDLHDRLPGYEGNEPDIKQALVQARQFGGAVRVRRAYEEGEDLGDHLPPSAFSAVPAGLRPDTAWGSSGPPAPDPRSKDWRYTDAVRATVKSGIERSEGSLAGGSGGGTKDPVPPGHGFAYVRR